MQYAVRPMPITARTSESFGNIFRWRKWIAILASMRNNVNGRYLRRALTSSESSASVIIEWNST
jgi:hypothetical protein